MMQFSAYLVEKKEISAGTYEVTFRCSLDEPIHFMPGQYVWLLLPNVPAEDPHGNRRAFSISDCSYENNTFSIVFRSSISGYKQALISLGAETEVHVIGPGGSAFALASDQLPQRPRYFIAGGVGIAAYIFYLRQLPFSESGSHLPVHVHFVNTSLERAFLLDELQKLSAQKRFSFSSVEGMFQVDGMLSVLDSPLPFSESEFFVCGTQPFVQRVYEELSRVGVPVQNMRFEQFYPVTNSKIHEYFTHLDEHSNSSDGGLTINPFQMLVNSTTSHLIVTDQNGQIVFANQAAQDITGFSFREMIGNTPRLWGGEMSPQFYRDLWTAIKDHGQPVVHEIVNRRKNGEVYTALARITPLHENNEVIGFVASEEDISERVTMEKEILYAKKKDEAMLNSIGEGLVAHNEKQEVILVNDAAQSMLGYSAEELVGHRFVDSVQAEDEKGNLIAVEQRSLSRAFFESKPLVEDHVYIRKNGSKFIARVTNSPIVADGGKYGVIQVFRDITHDREVDTMKTEFIALASHQLRTPLSTINWYIEMVLSGDAGTVTPDQKKFLTEAYQGAARMVSLVNALLNVARIESGTFIVDPKPTDIVQVARSVMDELKPEIDQKYIQFSEEHDALDTYNLDEELTRIIIENVLTNAVKYTLPQGKIHLEIRKFAAGVALPADGVADEDGFLIMVTDSGVGIPEHQKGQIFDKLFRADNVRKSDTQGTGLGLYITKRVVEQSNGKIWFTSTENEGSVFYIFMPQTGMSRKEGSRRLE